MVPSQAHGSVFTVWDLESRSRIADGGGESGSGWRSGAGTGCSTGAGCRVTGAGLASGVSTTFTRLIGWG